MISDNDSRYLECIAVTEEEYVLITDDFGLQHGVKLVNHHIYLIEYFMALHEVMIQ